MPTQRSIEKAAQVWCHPTCAKIERDCVLETRFAELLDEQEELHTMQLAGISTATVQNTVSTVKDRITKDSPYWTVAYQDVCAAVDREMSWREKALVRVDYLTGYQGCFAETLPEELRPHA